MSLITIILKSGHTINTDVTDTQAAQQLLADFDPAAPLAGRENLRINRNNVHGATIKLTEVAAIIVP